MQVAARARHNTNSFDIGPLVLTVGYRPWLPSLSDLIRPSNSSLGEAMIILVGVVDRQHARPSTFLATIDRHLTVLADVVTTARQTCCCCSIPPAQLSTRGQLQLVCPTDCHWCKFQACTAAFGS